MKQISAIVYNKKNNKNVKVRARFDQYYMQDEEFRIWCEEVDDYHFKNIE